MNSNKKMDNIFLNSEKSKTSNTCTFLQKVMGKKLKSHVKKINLKYQL